MQIWVVCQTCQTRMAVQPQSLLSDEWASCPMCEDSPLQVYIEDTEEEYV